MNNTVSCDHFTNPIDVYIKNSNQSLSHSLLCRNKKFLFVVRNDESNVYNLFMTSIMHPPYHDSTVVSMIILTHLTLTPHTYEYDEKVHTHSCYGKAVSGNNNNNNNNIYRYMNHSILQTYVNKEG